MKAMREIPGAPLPVGPYSAAVSVGNLVFCAGQIGLDPVSGQLVPGGVEYEARRVMENLTVSLAASGSSWSQVAMTTIFLSDMAHAKIVNGIYRGYINEEGPPARQTLAVKALPLGAAVEISLIAERDSNMAFYSDDTDGYSDRRPSGVG